MAGTVEVNHNQGFLGVPKFFADDGTEVPVDAIRWTLSDHMGGVFAQDGNNVSYVADATMPVDSPPRSAQLRAEVDENGVPNAFFDTWDVLVKAPVSPAATRMSVEFQVSDQ